MFGLSKKNTKIDLSVIDKVTGEDIKILCDHCCSLSDKIFIKHDSYECKELFKAILGLSANLLKDRVEAGDLAYDIDKKYIIDLNTIKNKL